MTVMSTTASYVAEGELEGEADGELEGVADTDADGVLEAEADGELDGVLDGEAEEITVPVFVRLSQRYDVFATRVTLTSSMKSPASASVASVSSDTFRPFAAVTTTSPPPSVSSRRWKRIPGFVGLASVLVSPEAPETIWQT